jgi:hypothetical protein
VAGGVVPAWGRKGYRLLIKHAFPAQRIFERSRSLVDKAGVAVSALDGSLCGNPWPGTSAVHVNER